jgi:hypothetical protein
MWPRILPFATYMAFIGISAVLPSDSSLELWLYPLKIIGVLGLLIFFWSTKLLNSSEGESPNNRSSRSPTMLPRTTSRDTIAR